MLSPNAFEVQTFKNIINIKIILVLSILKPSCPYSILVYIQWGPSAMSFGCTVHDISTVKQLYLNCIVTVSALKQNFLLIQWVHNKVDTFLLEADNYGQEPIKMCKNFLSTELVNKAQFYCFRFYIFLFGKFTP